MWYSEAGKKLSDEDIVAEKGDGLREYQVIMVKGRGNDSFVEDRVGQDIDKENLSLSDGEAEEVDGDFVGGGVQHRGHSKLENMLHGTPYILYQPEFSVLISNHFCMSFQSGAVFSNSQEIRAFSCQEIVNWILELEFRVYHMA